MTNLREQLITVADIFAAARGLSRSRVSTIVFNAGMALDRIASGRDLTTGNYERAMRWFSENWPEGAEWPCEVTRPASVETDPEAA
jgi:hypothetical protein